MRNTPSCFKISSNIQLRNVDKYGDIWVKYVQLNIASNDDDSGVWDHSRRVTREDDTLILVFTKLWYKGWCIGANPYQLNQEVEESWTRLWINEKYAWQIVVIFCWTTLYFNSNGFIVEDASYSLFLVNRAILKYTKLFSYLTVSVIELKFIDLIHKFHQVIVTIWPIR